MDATRPQAGIEQRLDETNRLLQALLKEIGALRDALAPEKRYD